MRRISNTLVIAGLAVALAAGAALRPGAAEAGFEAETLQLINVYRAQQGLSAMQPDPQLAGLALSHGEHMRATGKISHDGFSARRRQSGYRSCAENVAMNRGGAEAVVARWVGSSGHNRNLLRSGLRHAGLARSGPFVVFIACG